MDSSKIKLVLITVLAMFFAIYLGVAAATARLEAIAWIVGVFGLVFVLAIGKNVWMLIPLSTAMAGGINAFPGAPPPFWIATAVAGVMLLIRFLMRRTDTFVFRFNALDFAIALQLLVIAQAYLRNPTGLSILGNSVVGGKPYFTFAFAIVGYALLSSIKTEMPFIRTVVIGFLLISIADGALTLLTQISPRMASLALPLYSGADFGAAMEGTQIDTATMRLSGGMVLAQTLGLAAFALYRPITTFNPLRIVRFTMIVSALVLVMLSGFRSALGILMIYAVVSTIVRKHYSDLVLGGFVAILGLALIMGSGITRVLPFGAQRILSVIPFVDVEDKARGDAEDSSEWRFEMWRLVLSTDRYIKNKLLGDGFGYSAAELRAALDSAMGDQRMLGQANQQDMMLAKGSYHGFHVETIRFTGFLGLIAALVTMGIFFKYALSLIRYFRGRDEFGYVLFICMPYLIYPFYYMLVFGSYRIAFPMVIVGAGLLKILDTIRVRELAAARAAAPVPEPAQSPVQRLTPRRFPQPAMRSR
jgi:hypothetical protein